MSTHAILSPSKAARWMHCPGSSVLEAEEKGSVYAEAGSRLHAVAAARLNGVPDTQSLTGEEEAVIGFYVDFVNALIRDNQADALIETAVSIEPWTKEKGAKGTADAIVYNATDLYVIDLKTGSGVRVDAENNPQAALYALGALEVINRFVDVKNVHVVIVQPRLEHVSQWDLSVKALKAYGKVIKNKATICRTQRLLPKDELVLCPRGDICQFCSAKASCPALQALASEALDTQAKELSADDLGYWQDKVKVLIQFVGAVEDETERRLMAGQPVTGWKLVLGGRGRRGWSDEEAAKNALMDAVGAKAIEVKVISPAKAESLAKAKRGAQPEISAEKWAGIKELISTPEPKPTVAPDADPREAWTPEAANADDFDDIGAAA